MTSLFIDLTTRKTSEYPWSDEDRRKFIGCKFMATKIITDLVSVETNVFDEENIIVIATGPISNRFTISTLSPLTNNLETSNCGGFFGQYLKKNDFDAMIIKGKASKPTWIEIKNNNIIFHEASDLWGMSTSDTLERLNPRCALVIGQAGEKRRTYASIISNDRNLGKYGEGAVFGSKNLKGISIESKQIESYYCCEQGCGHLFYYQGKVIKKYEMNQLKFIGKKLGNSDLCYLFKIKELSDDLGMDAISINKLILEKDFKSLEEILQFIQDLINKEIKVYKENRDKKTNALKKVISAMGVCQLSRTSDSEHLEIFNKITGFNLTKNQLIAIANIGINLEKKYNMRRGQKT